MAYEKLEKVLKGVGQEKHAIIEEGDMALHVRRLSTPEESAMVGGAKDVR
jgi:hypothetical protein